MTLAPLAQLIYRELLETVPIEGRFQIRDQRPRSGNCFARVRWRFSVLNVLKWVHLTADVEAMAATDDLPELAEHLRRDSAVASGESKLSSCAAVIRFVQLHCLLLCLSGRRSRLHSEPRTASNRHD